MDSVEFIETAKRLRLRETSGGQQMQGSAKDLIAFLGASGQSEIEHMVLGVYGAMYHGGLTRIDMDFSSVDSAAMDGEQVRLEFTSERMVVERITPKSEEPDHD